MVGHRCQSDVKTTISILKYLELRFMPGPPGISWLIYKKHLQVVFMPPLIYRTNGRTLDDVVCEAQVRPNPQRPSHTSVPSAREPLNKSPLHHIMDELITLCVL